jgi:hypothetical protein
VRVSPAAKYRLPPQPETEFEWWLWRNRVVRRNPGNRNLGLQSRRYRLLAANGSPKRLSTNLSNEAVLCSLYPTSPFLGGVRARSTLAGSLSSSWHNRRTPMPLPVRGHSRDPSQTLHGRPRGNTKPKHQKPSPIGQRLLAQSLERVSSKSPIAVIR